MTPSLVFGLAQKPSWNGKDAGNGAAALIVADNMLVPFLP